MRRKVRFPADDVSLAGWLYEPDRGEGSFPLIVLAHGFAALPSEQMGAFLQRCYAERERRARGESPEYVPVAESGEFHDWLVQAAEGTTWKNEVTLLSREMFLEYEPGAFIHRISPTPLLMIVGDHDVRCLTDVQLAAFQQAAEPKRLVLLDAGHYDPYTTRFPEASTAARDLVPGTSVRIRRERPVDVSRPCSEEDCHAGPG